jgi:dTDP-4-dehydrorhamnose reductase
LSRRGRAGDRPVVVLGGSGMLGRALVRVLDGRGVPRLAPTSAELDLADVGHIAPYLGGAAPRAIVNAAAYTDVAGSELEANRTVRDRLNRDAPAELARFAAESGLPLVHVSTDYVYDGTKSEPYVEDDPTAPLQAYGRSKLEGELAVRDRWPRALIVRTSTLYGPGPRPRPHYVDAILAQARRQAIVSVVRLPVSSPTLSYDLASAIADLLDADASGVVHVANAGGASRLELARETVRLAGLSGTVEVREREEAPGSLLRPAYSILATDRFARICGRPMRPWREALAEYLDAR